jgi:hypothetical protein
LHGCFPFTAWAIECRPQTYLSGESAFGGWSAARSGTKSGVWSGPGTGPFGGTVAGVSPVIGPYSFGSACGPAHETDPKASALPTPIPTASPHRARDDGRFSPRINDETVRPCIEGGRSAVARKRRRSSPRAEQVRRQRPTEGVAPTDGELCFCDLRRARSAMTASASSRSAREPFARGRALTRTAPRSARA